MVHPWFCWLLLVPVILGVPPMVFFPSRLWAQRTVNVCGLTVLPMIGVYWLMTYGSHWDFSGSLIDPARHCYADGCAMSDFQASLEWAAKYGRTVELSVLAALLVISVACFRFDAWQMRRSRRDHNGLHGSSLRVPERKTHA